MSKAISRRDFIKVTGAVGAAGLLAACGGNSGAASSTAPASSAAAASVEAVGGLSSDRYPDHELVGRRVSSQRIPGCHQGFLR